MSEQLHYTCVFTVHKNIKISKLNEICLIDFRQENLRRRRDLSSQLYLNDTTNFTLIKTRSLHKRSSNSTMQLSPDIFPTDAKTSDPKASTDDKTSRKDPTGSYYIYIYKEVNASVTTLTLTELKHFTYYSISVKACREGPGDNCGMNIV